MRTKPAWESEDRHITILSSLASSALLVILLLSSSGAFGQEIPSSVSNEALRVCADPANMPFSDKKAEGFENKIAEILADELKMPVRYYFMPQGPGFVRNSLTRRLCDVVMGYAAAAGPLLHTNPYYQSVYVMVVKKGGPLDGVDRLSDPRLKGAKLGLMAATPPVDHLLAQGLLGNARTYALQVDHRYDSPAQEMIADLANGAIDGALLWGPLGGYYAKHASVPMTVVPLLNETGRPDLAYRITLGVRPTDHAFKQTLNALLRKREADIERVLLEYGVPLLDDDDRLVTAESAAAGGSRNP